MKSLVTLGGLLALAASVSLADTAPSANPTNSANNQNASPVATDQSQSKGDVDISAKIRRRLSQDDRLSVDAKNVKVITADGKVTLIGPVDSEAERKTVCKHAAKVAGKANVSDQLSVK